MSFKSNALSVVLGFLAGGFAALLVGAALIALVYFRPSWILPGGLRVVTNTVSGSVSSPNLTTTDQEQQIITVVEQVKPAVVSIVATQDVPVYEQYFEQQQLNPFGFNVPQLRQKGTQEQEVSSGSGFLVSGDGYIVTNKHVVSEDSADYTVYTNDGSTYPATIVARDPANDIAILKIEANAGAAEFPYLEFGDSDSLQVGQTTIAIGNALGEFSNSVSVGIVSGLARSIEAGDGYGSSEQLEGVIQTDAAINLGNSGGPLLNASGQVIGVNVAMAAAENIGFALPSNLVQATFETVKTTGKISRPYLGVRYTAITKAFQEQANLPVDHGALIQRGETPADLAVVPSSPADKAGLEENDIILEIDGQALDTDHDLSAAIGQHAVGDVVTLKVLHDGEEKTVAVTLEERPTQ
jgi:serine protease Do